MEEGIELNKFTKSDILILSIVKASEQQIQNPFKIMIMNELRFETLIYYSHRFSKSLIYQYFQKCTLCLYGKYICVIFKLFRWFIIVFLLTYTYWYFCLDYNLRNVMCCVFMSFCLFFFIAVFVFIMFRIIAQCCLLHLYF